jgi:Cohesin loading factor
LAFALCVRTDWDSAITSLKELEQWNDGFSPDPAPGMLPILASYLEGVIYQGTGNLTRALSVFQSPQFMVLDDPSFDTESNTNRASHDPKRDVSILASLNSILILRGLPEPDQDFINEMLSRVEPFCLSHSDQNIKAAYYFVKAIYCASDPLIKSKQFLQLALKTAKGIANNQLTLITLNFMSWKFFRGVVGEQAEKSSRASLRLAKKGMDGLWTSVAEGMLADSLEVQGKLEEARVMREEAMKSAETIVPRLKERPNVEISDDFPALSI